MRLLLRHKIIKLLRLFISFSDEGEDKLLLQTLPREGTYLDIGAFHPYRVSNTFFLYIWGWSGTCVDIQNKWKFKFFRHRDKFIYGYVGASKSYLFPRKLFTSNPEIAVKMIDEGNQVIIKDNIPNIDPSQFRDYTLLDLDIDGLDKKVLESLMNEYQPPFILVEDKCLDEQKGIYEYLTGLGYKRIANSTRNGLYKK